MLDPLTLGAVAALYLAFRKQGKSDHGKMTPEREEVYRNAVEFLRDPLRLEQLAGEFQKEGLKVQAAMLRKRAQWRSRTEHERAVHAQVFEQAMASSNVHAILSVAAAFEALTATDKAAQLRAHAKEVQDAADEVKRAPRVKQDIPRNTAAEPANGSSKRKESEAG